MPGADPFSLEGIDGIPDPAAVATGSRGPTPPATLPAEPSPTRDARRLVTRFAVAVACLWIGGALVASGVRADIAEPLVIAPLVAWSITVAAGLLFVLRPRARGLPAPVRAVQHAIWIVPAAYVTVVLIVAPGATQEGPPLGWATIRTCLGLANLMALGPLLAAAFLLRRSFLSASAWRGTAVGALAGLVGSIGVHAHCPVASLDHLLAAHGPAILVGALLGGILGRTRGSA